jgi:hypothetical protein
LATIRQNGVSEALRARPAGCHRTINRIGINITTARDGVLPAPVFCLAFAVAPDVILRYSRWRGYVWSLTSEEDVHEASRRIGSFEKW